MLEKFRTLLRCKRVSLRLGAAALTIAAAGTAFAQIASAQNTYLITDGDQTLVHTTYATDPAAVLQEAGLQLREKDTFTTETVDDVSEIRVNRLQTVTVRHGDEAIDVTTYGATVAEILEQLDIEPEEGRLEIRQDPQDATYDGMVIDLLSISSEIIQHTRFLPQQTLYTIDPALSAGEERTVVPGSAGEVRYTTQVFYENGKEADRVDLEKTILKAPVHAIVAQGTDSSGTEEKVSRSADAPASQSAAASENTVTTASGEVLTYKDKLTVEATAYSCESYEGITATGTRARYGAIAVDPDVIPYGTEMYIVSNDGAYIYGYAVAEDCGGAIVGNRIDLYFDRIDECWQFGRRDCTIYILD